MVKTYNHFYYFTIFWKIISSSFIINMYRMNLSRKIVFLGEFNSIDFLGNANKLKRSFHTNPIIWIGKENDSMISKGQALKKKGFYWEIYRRFTETRRHEVWLLALSRFFHYLQSYKENLYD